MISEPIPDSHVGFVPFGYIEMFVCLFGPIIPYNITRTLYLYKGVCTSHIG